tara:strand:+ start:16569 stop:22610 length:6042 start_codon:yes stop_codon:yes gene_type:complete
MGLSRLDNFLKNVKGEIIYVDSNNIDATDAVENQGNSLARPFKTLQRALIEAARFSYQGGLDNDRFNKTTILLYPGDHYIDNRPGWIPTTEGNFLLRGGVSSTDFNQFSATSNFDITNPNNDLYKLNSVHGGVIVPRGTSIVGMDLRKTKIRPRYVPNPLNDNIGRSALLRVTGACYFWQLSILDSNTSDFCYKDYTTNKFTGNFSHHKLTCFEYADGVNPVVINDEFVSYSTDRTDLDMYYEKVGLLFGVSSGRNVSPDYPDANLDIQPRVEEYRIVGTRSGEVGIASIRSGNGTIPSSLVTVILSEPLDEIDVDSIIRIEGINSPGYDGEHSVTRVINSSEIQYKLDSTPLDANPSTSGATTNIIIDTVDSASPYIFNCSLRSVFGLNGLHADGSKATGFKSMVTAQFTGIGLQKDNNAFVKYNTVNGIYQDTNTFGNENIHTDSRARFRPDWENFHIKCSNDGYIQCVSIFAIGFAKHFVAESGGDQSINNSNSNFGSHAFVASGFRSAAFPKDDVGYITHIIPPKQVDTNVTSLEFYPIDINATTTSVAKVHFYNQSDPNIIPEDTYQGYRIGAKDFDQIKVIQGNSTYSATIVMPNTETTTRRTSKKISTVSRTIAGISSISNNIVTFTEPHEFLDGESIRIISDNGNLPVGLVEDEIYYAITTADDFTDSTVQIKIAKTVNDALNNNEILINSAGGVLRVESRVSDKKPGELGHPIQYDFTKLLWYITVSNNSTQNTITSGLTGNGATSRSYFERLTDTRPDDDRIYRLRYVIPSDSPSLGRPPLEGYVLQESNSTIGKNNSEIVKQFSITDSALSNSTELRNFRIINSATWGASVGGGGTATGIATFTSELPHDLISGTEVEIVSIASTNNTTATTNRGFNGRFEVTGISTVVNQFSVEIPNDPGEFTGTASLRVTSIPRFKKVFTKDSFIIYRSEEVQEYIQGQQDGVYNLIVLNASNSPEVEPYASQKFSQPVKNLYPQLDRDNLKSDPGASSSYALSNVLGKVVLNDPEKSETKETLNKFLYNFGSGNKIVSITPLGGSSVRLKTEKNHNFSKVTSIDITNTGGGYGTGAVGSFFGAELTGGSGSGANALVSVNASGQLTGVRVIHGGSGYNTGDTLGLAGISTFASVTEASFNVFATSDCIDDIVEITGVNHRKYNAFGRIISIVSPNEIDVTLDNYGYHANLPEPDDLDLSNATYHPIGTKCFNIASVSANSNNRTLTITKSSTESTVKLNVGDTIKVSNNSANGIFDTNTTINRERSFIIDSISGNNITVKYGDFSIGQLNLSSSGDFIFHNGYSSRTGSSDVINTRTVPIYKDAIGILQSQISTKTTTVFSIAGLTNLGLNIGDYLQVNNEIVRIKETVSTTVGILNISVFRGVLGSQAETHNVNDPIKQIKVIPVELRRNSLIRASAHTFEYLGFGPGNYSTAFPEKQDRKLSADEEKLSHSLRYNGGVSVFSSMNADGNFFIGNKKINSASGKEEVFDVPVPSNVGETDYKRTDYNITSSDKVSVSKSIKVSGGKDSKDISEFYGPVFFGDKITSTSTKGLESVSIFLQGDETISRKFTISDTQPTIAGNPGDIVFNSKPADAKLVGWIYATGNQWLEFGDSPGIEITTDNSSGTDHYLTFLETLSPPDEIESLKNSSKLKFKPATGELTATKYQGDGGELDNIHPAALIPRDPVKSNNSFDNYLYETRKQFTLTDSKTITGSAVFGDTVFTSLDVIDIPSGMNLSVSPGTNFVVGEISGVFKTDDTQVDTQLETYTGTLVDWKVGIEGPASAPDYDNDVFKIMSQGGGIRTTVLSAGPDGVVGVNAVETMFNASPSSIDKLQSLQVRGRANQTGTHISILPRIGSSGASELRLWNGGPVTEWLIGQRSGTSHELSFSTLISNTVTPRVTIETDGTINANSFNLTSDIRLKENIKVIKDPLSLVKQINGVTFNWKDNAKPSVGLIAQEVEEILPQLVNTNDRGKSVNYSGIIGLLVECIKQQQVEIDLLRISISDPE